MPTTRSRVLLAVLSLTTATALAATMTGPAAGAAAPLTPVPHYTPTGSSSVPAPLPPTTSSSAPAKPSPLTGLRVTAVTPTSVTLAWNPSSPGCCDLSGYRIGYNRAFDDIFRMKEVGPGSTTATITEGITATGQFTFTVWAFDVHGQTSPSAAVTVVTPYATSGDVTPPSAPTGLTNLGTGPGGSTLTWTASTDDTGVVGYNVYNFDGLFISQLVATTTGTTATAVPSRFPSGNSSFYVRARDANGNLSAASNTVRAPAGSMPPSGQPSATVSSSPWEPPYCRFQLRITSRWAGGFIAEWTLRSGSPAPITSWSVLFRFAGEGRVASGWGGTYSQSGSAVTIAAPAWSPNIPAGGTVSGGFVGSGNPAASPITPASMNGIACALI